MMVCGRTAYPIETAPRDGSRIVGVYDDGDAIVMEWVGPTRIQAGPGAWTEIGPAPGHWVQTCVGEPVDEPPFWRPLEESDPVQKAEVERQAELAQWVGDLGDAVNRAIAERTKATENALRVIAEVHDVVNARDVIAEILKKLQGGDTP